MLSEGAIRNGVGRLMSRDGLNVHGDRSKTNALSKCFTDVRRPDGAQQTATDGSFATTRIT